MTKRRRKRNQVIGYVNVHLDDGRGITVPIFRKGGIQRFGAGFGWWHDGGPVKFEIKIGKAPRADRQKRKEI